MGARQMKERPILFSAPMVRAILDGRKTVTRRIVKPVGNDDAFVLLDHGKGFWPYRSDDGESSITADGNETPHSCPYGRSGDRLWVREAFHGYHWDKPRAVYRADGERQRVRTQIESYEVGHWTPSIHMPRWASRITLEIVSVRVERLQNISEEDAIAEGVYCENVIVSSYYANGHHEVGECRYFFHGGPDEGFESAVDAYTALWDSINGEGSWEKNPWVWVIEFKRGVE